MFPPQGGGGVRALSQLIIDIDKDWGGYKIKNVGTPVDTGDVIRKADRLSYLTVDTIAKSKKYIPSGETHTVKDGEVAVFITAHDGELYGDGVLESEGSGEATGFDLGA